MLQGSGTVRHLGYENQYSPPFFHNLSQVSGSRHPKAPGSPMEAPPCIFHSLVGLEEVQLCRTMGVKT